MVSWKERWRSITKWISNTLQQLVLMCSTTNIQGRKHIKTIKPQTSTLTFTVVWDLPWFTSNLTLGCSHTILITISRIMARTLALSRSWDQFHIWTTTASLLCCLIISVSSLNSSCFTVDHLEKRGIKSHIVLIWLLKKPKQDKRDRGNQLSLWSNNHSQLATNHFNKVI